MATHKLCPRCGIEKPVSEFGVDRGRPSGLKPWCKACRKIEGAADFQKHKAARQAKSREWKENNPGTQNAYVKAFQARNPEKTKASNKVQNDKRDPEQHRAESRRDYAKHREKRLARSRDWREQNKQTVAELNRQYRIDNPELVAVYKRNYKARKKGAEGIHTVEDIVRIRRLQDDRCAMPHRVPLYGKGHVDHRIPLAKGGTNDWRNIQLLCDNCNLRKHDKDPIDFARLHGLLI